MGINFSRALTLKFGPAVASFMNTKWSVISVGRVMTCVLGMVVRREREIRSFVKTPFYRVIISLPVAQEENKGTIEAEWRSVEGSKYFQSPKLYKENGFLKRETAQELINYLEVLTAQQTLLNAELTQVANRFTEIQGVINLYQALGEIGRASCRERV